MDGNVLGERFGVILFPVCIPGVMRKNGQNHLNPPSSYFGKGTMTLPYYTLDKGKMTISRPKVKQSEVLHYDNYAGLYIESCASNGYKVYRSTSKDGKYNVVASSEDNCLMTMPYNIQGMSTTMGKTYYYKARTFVVLDGKKYYSSYSQPMQVKIRPAAPSVGSLKKSDKGIYIEVVKKDSAKHFEIYWSNKKDGKYRRMDEFTDNTHNGNRIILDRVGSKGKTYYYKVRSYVYKDGKKVYSKFSTVKSIKY